MAKPSEPKPIGESLDHPWRWQVKTLQDPEALKIQWEAVPLELQAIQRKKSPFSPKSSPNAKRGVGPEEFKVYSLRGKAIGFKPDGDGDWRLMIEPEGHAGLELAVQIPVPSTAPDSCKLKALKDTNSAFCQIFGVNAEAPIEFWPQYRSGGDVELEITGVGYWDQVYGQNGLENGFEIHPALSIVVVGAAADLEMAEDVPGELTDSEGSHFVTVEASCCAAESGT